MDKIVIFDWGGVIMNKYPEDDNDKDIPDRDSTPDNKKPGEDDIDDAPVLISVATGLSGIANVYLVLGFAVLVTLASGIVLIKKFVV